MSMSQGATMASSSSSLTINEAFIGIVLATAKADGKIVEEEKRCMCASLYGMILFKGWSSERINKLVNKVNKLINEYGLSSFLETCINALPPQWYKTVFAVSVDLILADSKMLDTEQDFIYKLKEELKIDDRESTKIIEVMLIKNGLLLK